MISEKGELRARVCLRAGAYAWMWVRGCPRGRGQLCACALVPRLGARVFWWCSHSSLRASVSSTPPPLHPPASTHPVHPSIRQSVSPGSVHPFPYDLSFSLFRRREPKTNLALAGQPVPRARKTEAPRDSYTCRQTRLGLGRKGRSSPSWSPPSFRRAVSVAPAWSPESFLWAESWIPRSPDYFALLLGRPSRPFLHQTQRFPAPLLFLLEGKLGNPRQKRRWWSCRLLSKGGGGHPLADPSSPLKINSFCCFLFPSRFLFSLLPSLSTPSLFL